MRPVFLQGDDGAVGRGADDAAPLAGVPVGVGPVGERGVRVLDDRALEGQQRRHCQQIQRNASQKKWQHFVIRRYEQRSSTNSEARRRSENASAEVRGTKNQSFEH